MGWVCLYKSVRNFVFLGGVESGDENMGRLIDDLVDDDYEEVKSGEE